MARDTGGNFDNLKLFFMKVKGLTQGEEIHIIQEESKGQGNKPVLLTNEDGTPAIIRNISGELEGVYMRENEYKGETIRELKIALKDEHAQERYILGLSMSSIGRDTMNRLIGAGNAIGKIVEFGVYTNKKGYPAATMKIDGVRAEWKHSLDDLRSLIVENTVVKKGKESVERDYWNLETKLINELLAIYPPKARLEAPVQQLVSAGVDDERPKRTKNVVAPVNDDLPF